MSQPAAFAQLPAALQGLRELLCVGLGEHMGLACTVVNGDPQELYPQEFEAIRNAVPRRQREFAAGRQAAREALAQIGWSPAAIPSAPDRSPVWPAGLVGSIAHNDRACIAIVGRQSEVGSAGIDLENDEPIAPDLWSIICTPAERAYIRSQPASVQGRVVTRLFSAKEAFYKWQYPLTHRMLEFQQVEVELDVNHRRFSVSHDIRGSLGRVSGHIATTESLLAAWVTGHPNH